MEAKAFLLRCKGAIEVNRPSVLAAHQAKVLEMERETGYSLLASSQAPSWAEVARDSNLDAACSAISKVLKAPHAVGDLLEMDVRIHLEPDQRQCVIIELVKMGYVVNTQILPCRLAGSPEHGKFYRCWTLFLDGPEELVGQKK